MWEIEPSLKTQSLVKMVVVSHHEPGTTRSTDKMFKVGDCFLVTLEKINIYCRDNGIEPIKIGTAWLPESAAIQL